MIKGDNMLERLKKIILFIGLFLMFLYKDLIYLIPMNLLNIEYDSLSYNMQTLLSILASFVLVIIIVIIYQKYLKEKLIDYKNNFSKYFDIGITWWFIGIIVMAVSNFSIAYFTPVHEANNEALVKEMLKQAPILSFISASFIAPFLEEMLFRKSLGDIFKNKKVMIFMCGFIFGLLHVIFSLETPWDLLYIIPYGALGFAFAITISKTDNVFVPMTFHIIHNSALTLLSIVLTYLTKVIS